MFNLKNLQESSENAEGSPDFLYEAIDRISYQLSEIAYHSYLLKKMAKTPFFLSFFHDGQLNYGFRTQAI